MPVLAEQLRKYPFLRFLFPLILGICTCDLFLHDAVGVHYIYAGVIGVAALSFILLHYYKQRYTKRWFFGFGIFCLFFGLGFGLASYHLSETVYPWPKRERLYLAVNREQPQEKANSILCQVEITGYQDSDKIHTVSRRIMLYLNKDSLSRNMKPGDRILLYGKITSPHNNGNPDEFDYARFLTRKGVSGTAYIYSGHWQCIGTDSTATIWPQILSWRKQLLAYYSDLGFQGDNLAVLSALTLGYKEDLSEEIQESYSIAGASHVLALSGLHIGILYLLISFLLGKTAKRGIIRFFKLLLIVLFLWFFAFISGLSPSVIRSVILFTIIAIATLYNAKPVSLNTLGVAAFLMLLYDPFYIYDVSFQLSFVAVASIILIQPWLYAKVKVNCLATRYTWKIITMSIAAQIGTAPLVIYYFSRYSVYFLLTNLVVIPAVTFILYLAVAILILSLLPALQAYLVLVLEGFMTWLNSFVSSIEGIPFSSIDKIAFPLTDLYVYYFIMLIIILSSFLKKRTRVIGVLSCLFVLCLTHAITYVSMDTRPSILFYNVRTCPAVHFIQPGGKSYLLSAEREFVYDKLNYAAGRFWIKQKIESPVLLPADYEEKDIWSHQGITHFGGYTVCLVKNDCWRNKKADHPLFVDYMYICKGYQGKLEQLRPNFKIKNVVLDSSLSDYRAAALKKECRAMGVNFIALAEKGALQLYVTPAKDYK